MKKMILAMFLFSALTAQAALVTFEPGTLQLEGVNLNKTVAINDDKGAPTSIKLDLLGAGLRTKTVLFVAAKVYVLQLFSDSKATFSRDNNAISSLVQNSKSIALKISMLRTTSASTLSVSFKEALQANGFAMDNDLTSVLSIIENGADGLQGKDLVMLMIKGQDGKINLYYEDAKGALKSFSGSSELMTKILSIWLGKPADDGLGKLKTQLLNPVY